MELLLLILSFVLAAISGPPVASGPVVRVQNSMIKVRPKDAPPNASSASLSAAQNEFESFQIVVSGGASGVTGVRATASGLSRAAGGAIPPSEIMLYREGLYEAVYASNSEGAQGTWPDPLIPAIDAYYREPRNAFPFDVPPNENRTIWVEVLVPRQTTPGDYNGTVTVTGTGLATTPVPVSLRVRNFSLPSTSTLRSAFGISWSGGCLQHLGGGYPACGEEGVASYLAMYSRAGLDHRISINNATYAGDRNDNWGFFDRYFGPQIAGTAKTRLVGAHLTAVNFNELDLNKMQGWREHFRSKGWGPLLFHYTCDEPPTGCKFESIPPKAKVVHDARIPTLVTTDIDQINKHKLSDSIDIAVPLVNFLWEPDGKNRRPEYDSFLKLPGKELWHYQSCMSHACSPAPGTYFTGRPSYMIDHSAIQNRAMGWLSFRFNVSGELYWSVDAMLATAWETQWNYHGNGEGNLFYPGTPARIGGSKHIPIESIRLKLIRESMEDYEYLHMLCQLGDCESARKIAADLFPLPYKVTDASPDKLFSARAAIADRIEALSARRAAP